ncbi:hypothetical protein [Anaerobium acetethylicum]|uniref:Uncharacterized protein n=1 Tax=Anaerobium acetethylicum TaxID=1619234 RepID=A0A1D3TXJ1_9FIRM|nr:hypothetical protein [Anaerobium acetethylicum]SCP99063.1 hypothetical protein SAMN05421730_103135 [Anaerobium acetethylicum]
MRNMKVMAENVTGKMKGKLLTKKRGGKEILMELGLSLVAVVLLILFRDQIKIVLETIIALVSTKIQALFTM